MQTYEVIMPGFDGGSDETDHLIKWVSASSIDRVKQAYPDCRIESFDCEIALVDEVLED